MTKNWFAMAALALAAACGGDSGGSGVDGDKRLSALTAGDITSICEYSVAALRARREFCEPARDVTVADCVAATEPPPSTCTATVAQLEACIDAQAELVDDCDTDPPECEVLEACD
jgi:hypothetical protein